MKTEKSTPAAKKRNWAFVVYPESAPTEWRHILRQTGLQCAISPLHDKDKYVEGAPDAEHEKKAHWHVIAVYSGPTSPRVVKAITDSLNAPAPIALDSVRGYYRYLTHKDNPDKYQYDERDIETLNGFNVSDFVELTRSEVNEIKRRLQGVIRQSGITEYCDLMDLLLDSEMYLEHDVASSHTYFFDKYIAGRRHKSGGGQRV